MKFLLDTDPAVEQEPVAQVRLKRDIVITHDGCVGKGVSLLVDGVAVFFLSNTGYGTTPDVMVKLAHTSPLKGPRGLKFNGVGKLTVLSDSADARLS